MPRKIFYSWQSWLSPASNRVLIHEALEAACEDCAAHLSQAQRPELDHDTRGVPGTPDIARTIFEKIDSCDAFVADISLIRFGDGEDGRATPNPNVLIELGYAIGTLTWDRILLVMNTHFGPPEALPFDLKTRQAIGYQLDPGATAGAMLHEQKRLQADLKRRLVEILGSTVQRAKAEVVRNLQLVKSEAAGMAERARELNIMISARPSSRARMTEWAEQVLRLLRERFDPKLIDGAVVHIASELEARRMLREQLSALRRTAHAADRGAGQFVAQWDSAEEWGDLAPLHRQVYELMTTAGLVVQEVDARLAEIEKAGG